MGDKIGMWFWLISIISAKHQEPKSEYIYMHISILVLLHIWDMMFPWNMRNLETLYMIVIVTASK